MQIAQETAAEVKEKVEEFADDPILFTGKAARKWGLITLAGGIASYILAQVGKKLDQSYLNDIDNVLGISQETPPTQTTAAVPATLPPTPAKVTLLNDIVRNINNTDSVSASANIALLQQVLKDLWQISYIVYGVTASAVPSGPARSTQTPNSVTSNNVSGTSDLGCQLAMAIMQTCRLIRYFEGNPPSGPSWQSAFWQQNGLFVNPGETADRFLAGITSEALAAPSSGAANVDWTDAGADLSNSLKNSENYKQTLNGVANYLNVTSPFDLTSTSSNAWGGGILGVAVVDLSGVEQFVLQEAGSVVNDVRSFLGDLSTFSGDVGEAVALIGKVLLNLPRLGFDALGYAGWWAVDMVANTIWLPLVIIGAAALAWSIFALNVYPRIKSRLVLLAKARSARLMNWFDDKLKVRQAVGTVWTEKQTDAQIEAASVAPVYTRSTTVLPSVKVDLPGTRIRTRILKPDQSPGLVRQETNDFGEAKAPSSLPPPPTPKSGAFRGPPKPPAAPEGAGTPPPPEKPAPAGEVEPEPPFSREAWDDLTPQQQDEVAIYESQRVPPGIMGERAEGVELHVSGPTTVPTPTSETEALLGESAASPPQVVLAPAPPPTEPSQAELDQQEKARAETLPKPDKAARDRAASERMLRDMDAAFAPPYSGPDLTEHPGEEVEVTRNHRYPKPYSPMPPLSRTQNLDVEAERKRQNKARREFQEMTPAEREERMKKLGLTYRRKQYVAPEYPERP